MSSNDTRYISKDGGDEGRGQSERGVEVVVGLNDASGHRETILSTTSSLG